MRNKLYSVIVAVLGIMGIYVWYLYNKPHLDLRSASPDFTITASLLFSEYNENEKFADDRYIGKVIEVSGIVNSIEIEGETISKITLATDDPLSEIQCEMVNNTIEHVNRGEEVTVRCMCTGKLIDIILNKCAILNK